MTTVINLIWMLVVFNLASSSHVIEKRFVSTTRVGNNCKLNNEALKPDSLPNEDTELAYNKAPRKIETFIEGYYNDYAICKNGKYVRINERTKRYSDNLNTTITNESSAYETKRSKRFTENGKKNVLILGNTINSLGHVLGDLSGYNENFKLEESLCKRFPETCPLFDTIKFYGLSRLSPKSMANNQYYGPFDKNSNINFGDILACPISKTKGLIMHYMMGYNNSNLVIEGTGNTNDKRTSTKMSILISHLKDRTDDGVSRCYHLPLNDKSEKNIEKIENRLSFTLMSQEKNKILEYSLDTCNCQTLVLYWVYGAELRSCGGCTADMECSDYKFIESTYNCVEAKRKVKDCISDKYGLLSIK